MPGFLKTLFKPNKKDHRQSGPLPPGVSFSPTSPTSNNQSQDEIANLALILRDKLQHGTPNPSALVEQLRGQTDDPREMERLMQALKLVAGEDGRVSPFPTSDAASSSHAGMSRSRSRRSGRGGSSGSGGSDQWITTYEACANALGGLKLAMR